jgi:MFS transporter, DHA2 family, multidrug resistance protein
MTVKQAAPRPGRREWVGLAVLALACLLYAMDLSVLYLAVPSLSADLQPSSAQLLWITDVYGFLLAGSLLTMGTLGAASAAAGCSCLGRPRSGSPRCWPPPPPARGC